MKSTKALGLLVLIALVSLLVASHVAADPSPVTVSPANLNFGAQNVGTTSGAGAVSLTNHTQSAFTFAVMMNGPFLEADNCAETVAAGGTCTIKVYFAPAVVGAETGTMAIYPNGAGGPLFVSLSGTGTASGLASIAISPPNPSVPLGLHQQFTATGYYNNGNIAPLTSSVTWGPRAWERQALATPLAARVSSPRWRRAPR